MRYFRATGIIFPKLPLHLMELEGIWGQYFAVGSDHAARIILRAFTGTGVIGHRRDRACLLAGLVDKNVAQFFDVNDA
jgi:hypothetical protein